MGGWEGRGGERGKERERKARSINLNKVASHFPLLQSRPHPSCLPSSILCLPSSLPPSFPPHLLLLQHLRNLPAFLQLPLHPLHLLLAAPPPLLRRRLRLLESVGHVPPNVLDFLHVAPRRLKLVLQPQERGRGRGGGKEGGRNIDLMSFKP